MTPSQIKQLAANYPYTVDSQVAAWIKNAVKALRDAANEIERLNSLDKPKE